MLIYRKGNRSPLQIQKVVVEGLNNVISKSVIVIEVPYKLKKWLLKVWITQLASYNWKPFRELWTQKAKYTYYSWEISEAGKTSLLKLDEEDKKESYRLFNIKA